MTRILIGTPAYGGQVTTAWFHSMQSLQAACRERGIEVMTITMDRESLISRGRNTIVAEFLGRTEFTHLMFIDADIGFHPSAVLRLLEFNKPLVGTAYPKKGINWKKVMEIAKTSDNPEDLRSQSADFAINIFDEDMPKGDPAQPHPITNGFTRVSKLATGFMLIQRPVFDQLRARYPEKRYRNDISGYDNRFTKDNFWAFFDAMIHPTSRRYLSEDYGFCHLWQACGGEVWCDVQSRLTHFGVYNYAGHFMTGRTEKKPEARPAGAAS